HLNPHPFPTRRSSDLKATTPPASAPEGLTTTPTSKSSFSPTKPSARPQARTKRSSNFCKPPTKQPPPMPTGIALRLSGSAGGKRSEEHTSELQSRGHL